MPWRLVPKGKGQSNSEIHCAKLLCVFLDSDVTPKAMNFITVDAFIHLVGNTNAK